MQLSQAQLQYQIAPIILTGGIASNSANSMLPMIALTNSNAFSPNMLNGGEDFALDDAFGIFSPVAGGSLVQQTIAQYPFANLSVAANAIIRDPIGISLIMVTPMKSPQAWEQKLAIMTALKATLDNHNNAGGTYTVMTPGFTYNNVLMLDLVDVSMSSSPIPQNAWRFDFSKPLVSLSDATAAMNNLMSQVTNGVPSNAVTTSPETAIGQPASTVNTGIGAGASSPWVSQMPMVTNSDAPVYGVLPGGTMPGGQVLGWTAVTVPGTS
jgi:hypothetical protein